MDREREREKKRDTRRTSPRNVFTSFGCSGVNDIPTQTERDRPKEREGVTQKYSDRDREREETAYREQLHRVLDVDFGHGYVLLRVLCALQVQLTVLRLLPIQTQVCEQILAQVQLKSQAQPIADRGGYGTSIFVTTFQTSLRIANRCSFGGEERTRFTPSVQYSWCCAERE
jgi:hypothetical protein